MSALDIVVVSYNSETELRRNWLGKSWKPDVNVYVVDNSSTDGSVAVAREFATDVASMPNRGLSVANNVGFSLGEAPYVLFCNPDVEIEQDQADALVARLEAESCLVSARLLNPDGTRQPNARRFPTVPRQLANRGLGRRARRAEYLWGDVQGLAPTDWFLGACVGVRRKDLVRLGGWPNQYFLYFEDVALCREAWRQHLPVYVDNDVEIHHAWRQGSRVVSRSAVRHLRSAVTFYVENPSLVWPRQRPGQVPTVEIVPGFDT